MGSTAGWTAVGRTVSLLFPHLNPAGSCARPGHSFAHPYRREQALANTPQIDAHLLSLRMESTPVTASFSEPAGPSRKKRLKWRPSTSRPLSSLQGRAGRGVWGGEVVI